MNKPAVALSAMGFACLGLAAGKAIPAPRPPAPAPAATATLAAIPAPAATATLAAIPALTAQELNETIGRYCFRCHNDALLTGGLTLESFDAERAGESAEIAEKMIRKLLTGMMPPAEAQRPDPATYAALIAGLSERVDAAAAPSPGGRTFQRLNRAEYERSVRDLLGIEVDAGAWLPADTVSAGFDNIADVQGLSTTVMEGYLSAASEVSRLAVGDPAAGPGEATYEVPRYVSQRDPVEGAPFGTRGGVSVSHPFPANGEYTFTMSFYDSPIAMLYGKTTYHDEQIEISIDGERVALLDIDRHMDADNEALKTGPIFVRSGARRVTAAFLQKAEGPVPDVLSPHNWSIADKDIGAAYGVTTLPHLRDLAIAGPYNATGVSATPSRSMIFSCRPTSAAEESSCASRIIARLGAQAYRRPLSERDLDVLMSFYGGAADDGGFEIGVRAAIEAMLASPYFVFRFEQVAPVDGELSRIDDVALASRLSFFLWGAPPDEELRGLAEHRRLADTAVLDQQVERMLDDPRAMALGTRFAAQWLRLQDLALVHPDALTFPDYDEQLTEAMRRETELFFYDLVRADRSVLELLTADHTFVNERLARHYGIDGVHGGEFRRVALPGDQRRGLLGQGSILTLTSHADRTSPVLRGKWVMQVLLGSPPPPPPPDVPDLEATEEADAGRLLTVRERMEMHRANPACNSCHRMIDPIGLALENFDVTGAWRIKDNLAPIDAASEFYDGTPIGSAAELRAVLLRYTPAFVETFTENLMSYGLGRRIEYRDMPTVRAIARAAKADDYRVSSFIRGVVQSAAFRSNDHLVNTDDTAASGRR